MSLVAYALGAGAIGLGAAYAVSSRKSSGFPGPGSYPILGSYFHIKHPIDEYLYENYLGEPIVEVDIGTCKAYFLNTYETVKEAYIDQAEIFSGRPFSDVSAKMFSNDGVGGIVETDGESWKKYRKFSLKSLRDFGFGRKGAEDRVAEELSCLMDVIESSKGKPLESAHLLQTSIANVICQLVFGCRLASEDPKFNDLVEMMIFLTQDKNSFLTLSLLLSIDNTWVGNLNTLLAPVVRMGAKGFLQAIDDLLDFSRDQIQKHRKDFRQGDEPRDIIDMHIRSSMSADSQEHFSDEKLALIILDLFIAGTDTTANTLRWGILYVIQNPDIAERIFNEIQAEIGLEKFLSMSDKNRMNYTSAAIDEMHRLSTLVPTGLFHRNTEAAVIAGHRFPKDSVFFSSVYSIHRDPKIFPDPFKFNPERFLDQNGKYKTIEQLIPFGVGKRSCLGESLARMELFIFFTSLIQRYTFKLAPDGLSIDELLTKADSGINIVRVPKEHSIIFTRR